MELKVFRYSCAYLGLPVDVLEGLEIFRMKCCLALRESSVTHEIFPLKKLHTPVKNSSLDKNFVIYLLQERDLSEMGFVFLIMCLASALVAVLPFQEMDINSEVSM